MAKTTKRSSCANLEQTQPKKSKPSRAIEDVTELGEDPGRSRNEQFSAATKETAERSDAAIARFTSAADQRSQKVSTLLNGVALEVSMQNDHAPRSLVTFLAEGFSTHRARPVLLEQSGDNHGECERPTVCRVYNLAKTGIGLSQELVAHYCRICQQIATTEDGLRMDIGAKDDLQALQRVLRNQREKTKVEVDDLLDGVGVDVKERDRDARIADSDLWNNFAVPFERKDGTAGGNKGEGWLMAARHIQRGVQRIVKCLPEDN